ncbi:MAG: TlpA disulfide reductase family protein [Bacteroidota bacterium]|nr:TlpA disulfide reductase family protein [Bacteroidota bacterium]
MKLKTLSTILCALVLFACTKKDPNQVTIKGEITNPVGKSVIFSNKDTSYATTTNRDGSFSISFKLDTATYLNFEHGIEHTAMYVKPGDKIEISINTEEFDETISYKGSEESSFLAKQYLLEEVGDFFGEVFYMTSANEYNVFLDNFKNEVIAEFGSISDSAFIKNEIAVLEKSIANYITKQDKLTGYSQDVRTYMLETRNVANNYNFYAAIDSLNSSEYMKMITDYTNEFHTLLSEVSNSEFIAEAKERIKKTTDNWMKRKSTIDNLPKEGELAIDFSYPDKDGNEFSLASFKGDLIYVDVWATWCGPCKAEIPSLQKLEEEYHEQNITFLSVSVDTDRDAWLKMVEEKQLGGTQLWADGWSKITKDYAIFGIPRFMLFSAEGNVISTNAARPSSDEIRPLIDANL